MKEDVVLGTSQSLPLSFFGSFPLIPDSLPVIISVSHVYSVGLSSLFPVHSLNLKAEGQE